MEDLKQKAKLSMKQTVIVCVVFAVSLAILITVSYFMLYEPPTDEPGGTLPFDTTPNPTVTGTTDSTPTEPPVTYVPADDKQYNFLIIGHDRVAVLADVIMLVNFNVTKNSLTIMQIPRDTYVNVTTDSGLSATQVNAAFSMYYAEAFYNYESNPTEKALDKFTKMLEQNLCINIHYSAVMNLEGFVNIVNIIGGVEMDVPYNMFYEDPEQNLYINIKKGYQTLNGEQAEGFVRYRVSYVESDIGRGNAQKMFMAAFIKKLVSSINVSTVAPIADQVLRNVTTDMKVEDIVYFAKNALNLKLDKITMLTIPSDYDNSYDVLCINRKATLAIINRFFNVYSYDITNGIFDRDTVFCPKMNAIVKGNYYADDYNIDYIYTAEEIINGGIYIPQS